MCDAARFLVGHWDHGRKADGGIEGPRTKVMKLMEGRKSSSSASFESVARPAMPSAYFPRPAVPHHYHSVHHVQQVNVGPSGTSTAVHQKQTGADRQPSARQIIVGSVGAGGAVLAALYAFSNWAEDRRLDSDLAAFEKAADDLRDEATVDSNTIREEVQYCRGMMRKRLSFDRWLCATVAAFGMVVVGFGYDKLYRRSLAAYRVGTAAAVSVGVLGAVTLWKKFFGGDWYAISHEVHKDLESLLYEGKSGRNPSSAA